MIAPSLHFEGAARRLLLGFGKDGIRFLEVPAVAQGHRQAVAHGIVGWRQLEGVAQIGHRLVLLQELRPRLAAFAIIVRQIGSLGQAGLDPVRRGGDLHQEALLELRMHGYPLQV